jgi:tRNA A-37 threonylcarbamoyl transferase component Bud32
MVSRVTEQAQSPRVLSAFGKYLLLDCIAEGGMARVFLAKLVGVGGFEKQLVVKQIRPELAKSPRFVEMFVEEAKTLVRMNHPHVVPVYELGVVDGVYFLAMEYIEGVTLAELLAAGGALPAAEAAHVALGVAEALAYAHETFALIHRDVTPRNVILDERGHVRLLDFGIATSFGVADGTKPSAAPIGSLGYMSPEQWDGRPVDERSDLFALGAVLYESLSAKPAVLRATPADTERALKDSAEPPQDSLANVPAPLAELTFALLERAPEARPAKASAVAERCRTWLAANHPTGVQQSLGQRARAARLERRARPKSTPPPAGTAPANQVKTLATSPALDAWLGTRGAATASAPAEGTQPMLGRGKGAGDTANAAAGAAASAPPEASPAGAPRAQRRGPGTRAAAIVLLATLGGAAWWLSSASRDDGSVRSDAASRERGSTATPAPLRDDAPSATPLAASAPLNHAAQDAGALSARGPNDAGAPVERGATSRASTVTVNAIPWASLRLDGRSFGNTPRRGAPLSPGDHMLELDCPPLGSKARVPFRVEPGARRSIVVDLTTSPPDVQVR